ncbi:MAG: hypothetical protein JXB23_07015, partial [Candidatus Aminicenantes bacterium]|nr:hypothetical protein [Candidatus Aminicenantes bacterium]
LIKYREGIYEALNTHYVPDPTQDPGVISASQLQVTIPDEITRLGGNLEVNVEVQEGTGILHLSNPVKIDCIGTTPKIATISPTYIRKGTEDATIAIYSPNEPTVMNCFEGGGVHTETVVSIRTAGSKVELRDYPVVECWECENPVFRDFLNVKIPPSLTSEVQDLEIKVGNPLEGGGYTWSNSVILSIVSETVRPTFEAFPDTQITSFSLGASYGKQPGIAWQGIEGDAEITGFEYAILESGKIPNEYNWRWLDKTVTHIFDISELEIADGIEVFWVRAVDSKGRPDPTPAKTDPYVIDRVIELDIRLKKIRIDDDTDIGNWNPGEVFFDWNTDFTYTISELAWTRTIPESGDGLCALKSVWHMNTGDERQIDIPLSDFSGPMSTIKFEFLDNSAEAQIHLSVHGYDCDDKDEAYNWPKFRDLGNVSEWITVKKTESGYALDIRKWTGSEYATENVPNFGIGDTYTSTNSTKGISGHPYVGAYTLWYSITRLD